MRERDDRAGDRELVDLVAGVLVDPNVHTDLRMRLEREIGELVRSTHHELYGGRGREAHQRAIATTDGHAPKLLETVLVDPNLHAEMRMRIYHDIERMLDSARQPASHP